MLGNVHFDLLDNCISKEIEGLQGLYAVIRTAEYKEIIQHLSAHTDYTRRIIVAGVGKNSAIAEKATASMASLGIPAMPLNISHCAHGDYGAVGPNDTIIHISRSGKTKEMLEAIYYISNIRPNVTQILLHCNSKKPKSEAQYELWCGDVQEGDKYGLAPTTTTTTLLCLLDTIAVELSHRMQFTALDFFKYHPGGSLGASFTKVGFIYKTTNLVNGKFYVGKCMNDPRERYLGSGKLLKLAIAKYGEENFRREILQYSAQEELDDLERIWIERLNARVLGYNLQEGGTGGWTHLDVKGENNPMHGRNHSEESKHKMSETRQRLGINVGVNNSFYGKKHSDETKARLKGPRPHMAGVNNHRARAVIGPNGLTFDSITAAAAATGLNIKRALKSATSGWAYKEKK